MSIFKDHRGDDHGSNNNNNNNDETAAGRSKQLDLNPGPPNFKSGVLTNLATLPPDGPLLLIIILLLDLLVCTEVC